MSEPTRITLPVKRSVLAGLNVGDEVLLNGPVFTARDATHLRLLEEMDETGGLPHGLEGQTIFYAGPTPPAAGRVIGAVGPTTAKRMDAYTPALLRAGIVATIGKGKRSEEVRKACEETGSVYFVAVGGTAAFLAHHVTAAEPVAYEDLGPEALLRLELDDFPVFVGVDSQGRDVFAEANGRAGRSADEKTVER